jgi:hypothetical protein
LDKIAVLRKLRAIQDYLCSFEDQGVAVVDVSTTSFAQTLDWLHSYLLEVRPGFEEMLQTRKNAVSF